MAVPELVWQSCVHGNSLWSWDRGLSFASKLGHWQALVGAVLSSVCGNGSGSASLAAWLPGLCFERNVLVGGEVALIQIWPRGLPC